MKDLSVNEWGDVRPKTEEKGVGLSRDSDVIVFSGH